MRKFIGKHYIFLYAAALLAACAGMVLSHRWTMAAVKGMIMSAVLIKASLDDLKSREVSDSITACLLITGFIDRSSLYGYIDGAVGFSIIFVPLIIYLMIHPNGGFGGADIKISAAIAFIMGTVKGLVALAGGLTLAVITTLVTMCATRKKAGEEPVSARRQDFAAVPYISFAAILIYVFF